MSDYVIEKDVPIPPQQWAKNGLTYALRHMEVGDSVMAPGKKVSSIAASAGRLKPKKFTARTVDGGVRIWRIE